MKDRTGREPKRILVFFVFISIIMLYFIQFLALASMQEIHKHKEANRFKLIYTFKGYAVLLNENLTPVRISFKITKFVPTEIAIFSKDEILGYVKGTHVYKKIKQLIANINAVELYGMCNVSSPQIIKRNTSIGIVNGPILDIILPAGPCKLVEKVPILFNVDGVVYIENVSNKGKIKVIMNLTIPRSDLARKGAYVPIVKEEYNWLKDAFLKGASITAVANYTFSGHNVYQDGKNIKFCPLYIIYPRNAYEVRELFERGLKLSYYSLPIRIRMVKTTKTFIKYGKPPEIREVNEIVAKLIAPSLTAKLEVILPLLNKLNYEMAYYELASTSKSFLLGFVVNMLLGHNISISKIRSYRLIPSPYNILTSFMPYPEVTYIDHYPLEIMFPIKVKIIKNNSVLGDTFLFLVVTGEEALHYKNIDPYSIDIGFYEPPSTKHNGLDLVNIATLISLGLAAVIVMKIYKQRRKL